MGKLSMSSYSILLSLAFGHITLVGAEVAITLVLVFAYNVENRQLNQILYKYAKILPAVDFGVDSG